jgi:hypothetical protein
VVIPLAGIGFFDSDFLGCRGMTDSISFIKSWNLRGRFDDYIVSVPLSLSYSSRAHQTHSFAFEIELVSATT